MFNNIVDEKLKVTLNKIVYNLPSCAVSLYLQKGLREGSVNILNCSSEAIITLCACVVSGNGATPFSTSNGSGNGLLAPSSTAIAITGALCFSWISLAR